MLDLSIQFTLRKPFRWIIATCPNLLLYPDTLTSAINESIFAPSAKPNFTFQPQLSFLIPLSCHRASFAR